MKLATYRHNTAVSCGIVTDSGILDIPSNTEFHSIKEVLIKTDSTAKILSDLPENVSPRIPLDSVELMAPIPKPGKILALAGNYRKHLEETKWQDKTFYPILSSPNEYQVPAF